MALKNSQYYAIMREYEQKQLKSRDIQNARYEEVYKKLPEFKSLDKSISILSVQYGKKLLDGEARALDSLKEELEILRESKKIYLFQQVFPQIIWILSMNVRTVKTPDISVMKNVTASSGRSSAFYMNSQILENFRQKLLLTILSLIFIRLHFMIKQPGAAHVR